MSAALPVAGIPGGRNSAVPPVSSLEDMMIRKFRTFAVAAICCAVAGAGLTGCTDDSGSFPFAAVKKASTFTGTKKIQVAGKTVHVSCSGERRRNGPVVVLLHGGGDGLDKMAAFQKTL